MQKIFAILCSILSISGGLFGYKIAVSQSPFGVKNYILALTVGMLIQIILTAISSNRKDRLTKFKTNLNKNGLRLNIALYFSWLFTFLFGVFSLVFSSELIMYVALYNAVLVFQYSTFLKSSVEQIRNLENFWRIQFIGALMRLISVLFLVYALNLNYLGILVSNLIAAIVISIAYKSWPVIYVRTHKRITKLLRSRIIFKILTIDGFLRATKGSYESVAFSICAVSIDRIGLMSYQTQNSTYTAIGYMNTVVTAARQVFSSWEYKKKIGHTEMALAVVMSSTIALGAVLFQENFQLFNILLPRLSEDNLNHIIKSTALITFLYPITRGFLYVDYINPSILIKISKSLVLSFIVLTVISFIFMYVIGDVMWFLWCISSPLSIAYSLRNRNA